jgi:hypothetical protein
MYTRKSVGMFNLIASTSPGRGVTLMISASRSQSMAARTFLGERFTWRAM